ncbi:MAG: AAA family ATPase [Gammaproteobacteria bacterium]|nr:AAA family ATPase [Gammaproteobacteria bacterium]
MSNSTQLPPLIQSLLDPAAYPHPAERCELIETHISWVILAGDYVYKIKKPFDLGFLDFSTLEKRRFYCDEELRLNRRLAPAIYLDTVAIGGTPRHPELGAQTKVIEYAVKMRRFPQQAQLDRMLARGQLEKRHIDAFARMAAAFHQRVAMADAQSEFGTPAQVWQPVAENFSQIREHAGTAANETQLAGLEQWSRQRFERLTPLLKQRKENGFIRECHGDMHLRNLAWIGDEPLAFDGIEFNPALRWIDVISEVAFLVMDLQARKQPQLAQRFLNNYLEISGDYEALQLLPFYLVYRALVRAKVAAIRSAQAGLEANGREEARQEFAAYLALAEGYTRPGRPAVIIARGMSASGKTTLTGPLLERLEAIRLRSDVERKRLFGLQAETDGRAAPGEGIYSSAASERTYDRLAQLAQKVLVAGYPVIIDAVCQHHAQRQCFTRLARERGIACLIVEFTATPNELRRRIVSRKKGASDADLAVLEHQLAGWQPLTAAEQALSLEVDTACWPDTDTLYKAVVTKLRT